MYNFGHLLSGGAFFGGITTLGDSYYLVSANFSPINTLNWRKKISWVSTTDCATFSSAAINSKDGKYIYAGVLYDLNFLFYVLNEDDGSPINLGLVKPGGSTGARMRIRSMAEFDSYVALDTVYLGATTFVFIKPLTLEVFKEFSLTGKENFVTSRRMILNNEYILTWGSEPGYTTTFYSKYQVEELGDSTYYVENPTTWANITSPNYIILDENSLNTVTYSTSFTASKTNILGTFPKSGLLPLTITNEYGSFESNEAYNQSFRQNQKEVIELQKDWIEDGDAFKINYDLVDLGIEQVPDWVQYDPSTYTISLDTTPNVSSLTNYQFALEYQAVNMDITKEFYISIEPCFVDFWNLCVLGNSNDWEIWDDGYRYDEKNQKWREEIISQADTVIINASVVVSLALSFLLSSFTSSNGLFSLINQYQLLILLPMMTFIDPEVIDIIIGVDFSMLSFDFLPIKNVPLIKEIPIQISRLQPEEYLNSIGLQSISCLVNNLSGLSIFLMIWIVHAIITCFHIRFHKRKEDDQWRK